MNYFDLHCDTATCLYKDGGNFLDTDLFINFHDALSFRRYCQTFAFWFDDEKHTYGFEDLKDMVSYFDKTVPDFPGTHIRSIEGGDCLDGNPDNLMYIKNHGFRIFGFSWNGENALATGNKKDPKKGLTDLGKEVLSRLNDLDIAPDISHLSDQGAYDVLSLSKKPVVATHSLSRAVFDHKRNITDEMIKEIINKKGLVGLNLYPAALSENPKMSDLLFHAEHILSLGGKDILAMGCDWDGTKLPPDVKGLLSIKELYGLFEEKFGTEIADAIFYDNAARFFSVGE